MRKVEKSISYFVRDCMLKDNYLVHFLYTLVLSSCPASHGDLVDVENLVSLAPDLIEDNGHL